MRTVFSAVSVPQPRVLATMRSVYETHGYLLCPHSAVGYAVAVDEKRASPQQPVVRRLRACVVCCVLFMVLRERCRFSRRTPPNSTRPFSWRSGSHASTPEHDLYADIDPTR